MAENVLETRIQLRYDTYSNWMNSNVILKAGEAAIASFPSSRSIANTNIMPEHTPPAIGIKIGNGTDRFRDLPWVQAVAADVYNWAKTSNKPIYTASEIQGLQTYIEEHMPGQGGEYTIAPRLYQIVQGKNDDDDKYYLQYKESGQNDWTVDVNHYIDLSDLKRILNWIVPENLTQYANLTSLTGWQTFGIIGSLENDDKAQTNMFVTQVKQTGGIVSVLRAQPSFSNLIGSATVTQGGTGLSSLPIGEVLVGAGANPVSSIKIATEIADNNYLVPNYLVKNYIDTAVEGLTGAMHFIGEANITITPNSSVDPRIPNYDFSQAQPGDVILFEAKEYVWTGGAWRLLGDEGSYAVKGSIKDVDIAPDAAIQQSKIAGLDMTLATKVDKVEGKGLSTNDFTNELNSKLLAIEAGAQRNVIEHIFLNNTEIFPTIFQTKSNSISLTISEFDAESRTKLAGIAEGAQVNIIEHITLDGTEFSPDANKTIALVTDPHTEHVNKIESIYINGREYPPNNLKEVRITLNSAVLDLTIVEGAVIPGLNGIPENVVINANKKLELARIAKTGNIKDISQSEEEYITLYCGSSIDVI